MLNKSGTDFSNIEPMRKKWRKLFRSDFFSYRWHWGGECWISICLARREKKKQEIHLKVCKTRVILQIGILVPHRGTLFMATDWSAYTKFIAIWLLLSTDVGPFELGHTKYVLSWTMHRIQLTMIASKAFMWAEKWRVGASYSIVVFLPTFFFVFRLFRFFMSIRCCFQPIKCLFFQY